MGVFSLVICSDISSICNFNSCTWLFPSGLLQIYVFISTSEAIAFQEVKGSYSYLSDITQEGVLLYATLMEGSLV